VGETTSNVEMAHKIHEQGQGKTAGPSRMSEVIEIIEAVVLAIVAVATAWSGYQAAQWDGRQALLYGQSSRMRITADSLATIGGQERIYDTTTFNAWLDAYARGDQKLAGMFERRFRPEYRAAFDAWLKTDPFNNPKAPPGPVFMPQYHNANESKAAKLNEQATTVFDEGTKARETGDDYVRITVFLATVLLLTAIGQRFRIAGVRTALLVVAFLLLSLGLWNLVHLPRI